MSNYTFEANDSSGKSIVYSIDQENDWEEIQVRHDIVDVLKREAKEQKKKEEAQLLLAQQEATSGIFYELEEIPDGFDVFDEED